MKKLWTALIITEFYILQKDSTYISMSYITIFHLASHIIKNCCTYAWRIFLNTLHKPIYCCQSMMENPENLSSNILTEKTSIIVQRLKENWEEKVLLIELLISKTFSKGNFVWFFHATNVPWKYGKYNAIKFIWHAFFIQYI